MYYVSFDVFSSSFKSIPQLSKNQQIFTELMRTYFECMQIDRRLQGNRD